jgi:heme A synthase
MVVPASSPMAGILAVGFGMTTAMWTMAYFGWLPRILFPGARVPAWLLLATLVGCLLIGGYLAGRYIRRCARDGLYVGLLSAVLNLMVLGSVLGGSEPGHVLRHAAWWVPAWMTFSAAVAVAGGMLGAARGPGSGGGVEVNWTGVFAKVAVAAVLLLLLVGGMVTSEEAGLAVVDWPNSFGTFMFLLPLSRMTGGSYFEHSHRLIGSLVGLTTLVLAVHLWWVDPRSRIRWFILLALLAVIGQGVLGGFRVTGHLTFSQDPAEMNPKTSLAIVHGVFGQVVFTLLMAVAVLTSTTWYNSVPAGDSPRRRTDRLLDAALPVLLLVQLSLGALVRHLVTPPMQMFKVASHLLLVHVAVAILVIVWAVLAGARAWGFYGRGYSVLRRFGLGLIAMAGLQAVLGFLSLVVTGLRFDVQAWPSPTTTEVVLTTAHQTAGAVMLAAAAGLALWIRRDPIADGRSQSISLNG